MPGGAATRTTKTSGSGPTPRINTEIPELHTRIAMRAYQIYEESGRVRDHDLDNWLQAEQELLSERLDSDLG